MQDFQLPEGEYGNFSLEDQIGNVFDLPKEVDGKGKAVRKKHSTGKGWAAQKEPPQRPRVEEEEEEEDYYFTPGKEGLDYREYPLNRDREFLDFVEDMVEDYPSNMFRLVRKSHCALFQQSETLEDLCQHAKGHAVLPCSHELLSSKLFETLTDPYLCRHEDEAAMSYYTQVQELRTDCFSAG